MWLYIVVFLITFFMMEFMAWFTHKFIMHGFLWSLHADHHKKDHDSWFERNDAFFIFYAVVSMTFFFLWQMLVFCYILCLSLDAMRRLMILPLSI